MRPFLITLCLLLSLLAVPVLAEDAPPAEATQIDPAKVGKLLLSDDAATRARGEALLQERIAQGGDLGPFLREMAEAQAGALREARKPERRKAKTDAHGPEAGAVQRAQEAAPEAAARVARSPALLEPPPPLPVAQGPEVHALVVEVDRQTVLARLSRRGDAFVSFAHLAEGGPLVLRGEAARRMIQAAPTLVDARVLLDATRRLGPPLVAGERIRWRRALTPTKAGAWAIRADDLSRGIEILAKVVPAADGEPRRLVVEGRRGEVPLPLPVSRVRPAEGVDPVELDRPEWEVIRIQASTPYDGTQPAAILLPGLLPNRILLVAITPN